MKNFYNSFIIYEIIKNISIQLVYLKVNYLEKFNYKILKNN